MAFRLVTAVPLRMLDSLFASRVHLTIATVNPLLELRNHSKSVWLKLHPARSDCQRAPADFDRPGWTAGRHCNPTVTANTPGSEPEETATVDEHGHRAAPLLIDQLAETFDFRLLRQRKLGTYDVYVLKATRAWNQGHASSANVLFLITHRGNQDETYFGYRKAVFAANQLPAVRDSDSGGRDLQSNRKGAGGGPRRGANEHTRE